MRSPSLTSFRRRAIAIAHFYFTATASRSRLTTRLIIIAITIPLVPVVALHYLWCQWTCLISAKMDMATRDLLKKWNLERYIDRFESKLTNLPSKLLAWAHTLHSHILISSKNRVRVCLRGTMKKYSKKVTVLTYGSLRHRFTTNGWSETKNTKTLLAFLGVTYYRIEKINDFANRLFT